MTNIRPTSARRTAGFTLIELMVVVVIVAILAAIAYPSYIRYVQRTNEAAAQGQIMELASALEAHRAKNFSYAGASIDVLAPELADNDHYLSNLALGAGNQSYTITAAPSSSAMAGMDVLIYTSAGEISWE